MPSINYLPVGALALVFEQIRFADDGEWSCVAEEDKSVRNHFKLNVIRTLTFYY